MTTAYQNETNLLITLNESTNMLQKHHIVVLDISTSMESLATINDESGNKVETQLSYLDLTKHCIKMYIHSIVENDLFTLIVFSDNAYNIFTKEIVNKDTVEELINRLMRINANGLTNLWAGIKAALYQLEDISPNYINSITVYTDGVPNNNPPRGITVELGKYLEEFNITNVPIHILGFGYNLEINTLTNISDMTNGSFNFIPTAAEMITVMVHLISNIKMKYNKGATLKISYETITEQELLDNCKYLTQSYNIDNVSKTITINIGQVNTLNILLKNKIEYNPRITYTVNYLKQDIQEICIESIEKIPPIFRATACFIEHIMNMYDNATMDRIYKNKQIYTELLSILDIDNGRINSMTKDLTGEIKLALLDSNNFTKWGKYYIPSIIGAYKRQECNNFRDFGIQHFCSEEFKYIRDIINELCDTLPEPQPTQRHSDRYYANRGYNVQQAPRAVNVRSYEQFGGCIHPECLIKTPTGFIELDFIKKGDEVINSEGTISIVECITHHKCPNNQANLCKIGCLLITPYHPIINNNSWQFPIDINPSVNIQCNYVINLVLEDRKSVNINNIVCCTLGHGLEGDVISHPFFGTEKIIENFKEQFPNEYYDGLVKSTNTIKRDPLTGLVMKYL